MAFDVKTLDGVQFTADQIGYVAGGNNDSLATGNLTNLQGWAVNNSAMYFNYAIYGVPVIYGTADGRVGGSLGSFGVDNPSAITVVNNYYSASFVDAGGYYHAPVFGRIAMGDSIFEIRGFGEDGRSMLLVDVTNSGSGIVQSSTANMVGVTGAFVVSLDTLPVYTSSNTPIGIAYQFGAGQEAMESFMSGLTTICFTEGTRIETGRGMIAVEDLVQGDMALTASGAMRPIKWIGQMVACPMKHPRRNEVNPVRVVAHAFGPGCPAQDVRLSPGHAVFVDGVLVPVGHLVNGATIVQEEVEQIRYFHVELDSHDVLLAEGLPCESYLDDGNRRAFANNGESVELFGRLDPKNWDDACAPVVAGGLQLFELQRQLHARAAELGWVKNEDPELQIIINGAAIKPVRVEGDRYLFNVPVGTALTLHSNASVLAQIMPGVDDTRRLGVAVASIHIDGVMLDLEAGALGKGFYPAEGHGWRWTNGNAEFVLPGEVPAMVEITLAMIAPSWKRLAVDLQVAA